MTTELDIAQQQHAEIVPALPKPGTTAAALDMLRGHAEMMAAAHQLASAMVKTAMVPAVYRGKADDAAAAILYGSEIGLNPIQSLQQVFPIHGQPAIYARTMVALLKARGFRFRTIESTDQSVTVSGTSPSGEAEESTWTIERADQAGYLSNKKYETDPQAMLYAKACAEVCRKLAPDVLLGISHTREDLELEPVRVESERVTAAWKPVAEILDAEEPAGAPKVQQWQAPAEDPTASDSVEKPDVEQVRDPEPAEKPAAKKSTRRKPTYTPGGIDGVQVGQIGTLLDNLGVTEGDDKTAYLREFFKRPELVDVRELTPGEGKDLIAELTATLAAPMVHVGDQAAEGGAQ